MEPNKETDLFESSPDRVANQGLRGFIAENQPASISVSMEHLLAAVILGLALLFASFYLGYLRGKSVLAAGELRERSRVPARASVGVGGSLGSAPLVGTPRVYDGGQSAYGMTNERLADEVGGSVTAPASTPRQVPTAQSTSPINRIGAANSTPNTQVANTETKPYTIQVIAFRNRSEAQSEASLLKKKGYTPTVKLDGSKWVVLVGRYKNRNEARKDLTNLKKRYNDCYLKKAV